MRQEEYKALVQAARETDLVTYFQQNGFTVERKGSEFYVKEYPSLCIKPSTNQWYFHYTREGATNNSINCLTKVLGMDFNQAVFSLTGQDISRMRSADFPKSQRPAMTTPPRMPRRKPEKKELQMPEQSEKTGRLFAYLCQTRKIPPHQMQRELAESRKKIAELESAQSSPFKAFYYSSPDKQAWVQQQLDERVIPYRETENGFEAQACYVQTIRRIEQDFRVPRTSARDRLREDVDRMLMQSRSFDELLARLERAHYEVKRGKYIAVKPQNFGTFIRLKSLGEFYSEAALRNRLFEKLAYEQKLVREMEQAKMSNAPNYRVLAMQHYYIISFSKGYLPVRKKNPNRVLSWVNDAELYRLTALKCAGISHALERDVHACGRATVAHAAEIQNTGKAAVDPLGRLYLPCAIRRLVIHVKSIPVRSTVHKTLSYILNPDKTEGLLYTSSMNCMTSARDAYLEMKSVFESFSMERFNAPPPLKGKGTVKAIHYIQSFDPNPDAVLIYISDSRYCCRMCRQQNYNSGAPTCRPDSGSGTP